MSRLVTGVTVNVIAPVISAINE